MHSHFDDLAKGMLGSGASVLGVLASLSDLEAHLRIASLLIGITVGILTGISILRNWNKPK